MMSVMWIRDVDLARLDASLFLDVTTLPTTLVSAGDATVTDTVLESASSDFPACGVQPGHVVSTTLAILEVIEVLSTTTLRVSRLRCADIADLRPGPNQTNALATVRTFERVIADVEFTVLRRLGIAPAVTELPPDVRRLLALETLARAFGAEGANRHTNESLVHRAAFYAELSRSAEAHLDRSSGEITHTPGVTVLDRV